MTHLLTTPLACGTTSTLTHSFGFVTTFMLPTRPAAARARPAPLGPGGLSKGEQMAAYLARHYQEKVVIENLARAVRLHPNYAMSLFKQTFHMTLLEYLTQYRISHAQRLLATTDRKIVDVALDSGYPTLSRFYEAFARACGCSPRQYRTQHRGSSAPFAPPGSSSRHGPRVSSLCNHLTANTLPRHFPVSARPPPTPRGLAPFAKFDTILIS